MTKIALLLSLVLLVLVGYAGIAHLAERVPFPPARTASDNTGGTVQYRSGATRTPDDPSEHVTQSKTARPVHEPSAYSD